MPDDVLTKPGTISVGMVCRAVSQVVFESPTRIEAPASCQMPRLCSKTACRFPRYFDNGPRGIVANTLIRLGFSSTLLKDLDTEYRVGEILHPGVEVDKSRNLALARIEPKGLALLAWFQDQTQHRLIFSQLHVKAFRPRRGLRYFDRKERPWLY